MIQQTLMTQYKPVLNMLRIFFPHHHWCRHSAPMFNPLLFIHRLKNPSPAVDVKNLGDSQLLTENGKNSEIMLNPD